MCPFDKKEATERPLLLRLVVLRSFDVRQGDEQACSDDQRRTQQGSDAHRLAEDHSSHYDTGDRFQCAENGSTLPADDKSTLLEQHHRTAGYHRGEE